MLPDARAPFWLEAQLCWSSLKMQSRHWQGRDIGKGSVLMRAHGLDRLLPKALQEVARKRPLQPHCRAMRGTHMCIRPEAPIPPEAGRSPAAQQPCAVPTHLSQCQSSGAGVAVGVEYTDSAVSPVVRLQPDTSSTVPGRTAPENHLHLQSKAVACLGNSMRRGVGCGRALRSCRARFLLPCTAHTPTATTPNKLASCARYAPKHHAAVARQAVAARPLTWVGGHKHLHQMMAASRVDGRCDVWKPARMLERFSMQIDSSIPDQFAAAGLLHREQHAAFSPPTQPKALTEMLEDR